ncbi:hypothetical protein H6G81_10265 [Scytonema hofmannii FACHB-248]|uniref:Uncharacterized protein n=1 Tax=Scytonema hofmannii FACHB-248 TaxID=1842502 RepID=A0ABR8GP32_9CYAN|nr:MULTISPECIES: hypothetical protein [Nostocales]MBD2604900.1 hypothetical protein [Scytonema hofmannii FACHB-248]
MVRLLEKRQRTGSILTIFAIATFSLHLSAIFLLIFQGINIRQLSVRKAPNFVQLIDGKPADVTDLEREPEAIRQFVSKTMTSMFNWSGKLPPESIEQVTQPQADAGISIQTSRGGSRKVSTTSWIASFALSEDFRKGFLSTIAEMTPPEVFYNKPSQNISGELVIKRVYPPEKIGLGKWRVGMVADLIQKKQADNRTIVTRFNKDLLVRAVDSFAYPQLDNTTVLQKAIYSVRADQLEIYEIRNLCLIDEYNNQNPDVNVCGNRQTTDSFIK